MRLMHERGYKLGNLDATIIAEVLRSELLHLNPDKMPRHQTLF